MSIQSAVSTASEVPVLFFQAGDARHLPYTFWQAQHRAGGNPLILLGDRANRHYPGLDHVPIRDFASAVPGLRDAYVHLSSNSWEFEFFSLARWLVIEEFARRQGLREFLCLDSDVLLYEDPAQIASRIPTCHLTLAWHGGDKQPSGCVTAGESLIRKSEVLSWYIEIIQEFYRNPAKVSHAREEFAGMIKEGRGGISDMWFWRIFGQAHAELIQNSWQPEQDGVLDIIITEGAGFRCREGIKEVEFRSGQPYGFYEPSGVWKRFATLHFGGHSKRVMRRHLGQPANFSLACSFLGERLRKGMGRNRPEPLWRGPKALSP